MARSRRRPTRGAAGYRNRAAISYAARMSESPPWLSSVEASGLPAKARRLAELSRAGLPVPRGLVLSPSAAALDDPTVASAVAAKLKG